MNIAPCAKKKMGKDLQKDFPIFDAHPDLVYFDAAATSHKPKQVIDALCTFYSNDYGSVHRGVYFLAASATDAYHKVRQKIASFIKAKSEDQIVFTKGTTDSINLIAQNSKNKTVLLNKMEHHANIVPWQIHGAKTSFVHITDQGELDLDDLERLLKKGADLVSIAHVANSTGTIHPIKQITHLAHSYGAKVLVDAAQSVSHFPIDVADLGVDYLAFSSHKAFGPTGLGVLYGTKEALDKLSPVQGGGDMIEKVGMEKTTFGPVPLRFEAGTPPIAQVIGFGSAIDYLLELGLDRISEHEAHLTSYAIRALEKIDGLRFIGRAKNRSSIISFVIDGVHHLDLGSFLDLRNIAIRTGHHCAQLLMERFGILGTNRISFSPFNTIEEIDQMILAIQGAIRALRHK